jgi:hypothetical protein
MQGVKRFTRKYIKARATKCFVDRFLEELECALPQRKDKGKAKVGGGRMPPQWIPPPVGMMKINVDASVSKNKKISSVVLLSLTIQPECF